MTDLERFEHLFREVGIQYEKSILASGRTELDIEDKSMAHGCELEIQFDKDGKFYMFLTS